MSHPLDDWWANHTQPAHVDVHADPAWPYEDAA